MSDAGRCVDCGRPLARATPTHGRTSTMKYCLGCKVKRKVLHAQRSRLRRVEILKKVRGEA